MRVACPVNMKELKTEQFHRRCSEHVLATKLSPTDTCDHKQSDRLIPVQVAVGDLIGCGLPCCVLTTDSVWPRFPASIMTAESVRNTFELDCTDELPSFAVMAHVPSKIFPDSTIDSPGNTSDRSRISLETKLRGRFACHLVRR